MVEEVNEEIGWKHRTLQALSQKLPKIPQSVSNGLSFFLRVMEVGTLRTGFLILFYSRNDCR